MVLLGVASAVIVVDLISLFVGCRVDQELTGPELEAGEVIWTAGR
jgi:hypothetical protein